MASRCAALAALLLLAMSGAQACVYLMGDSKDSLAAHPAGTHWTYGFRGDDWEGVDGSGTAWKCTSGRSQSPINLANVGTTTRGDGALKTRWNYSPLRSNGTNIQVFNNGHTIQVQWPVTEMSSNVVVSHNGNNVLDVLGMRNTTTRQTAKATPIQFHFHTDSEHAYEGTYYPMELHIVHTIPQSAIRNCPASGCLSVTGILFKLDPEDRDNAALNAIWEVMPLREGQVANMTAGRNLDIMSLLPPNKAHVQYSGSLTTPPCTEGLLWHVFTRPVTMSLNQLRKYQRAVGLKSCEQTNATSADHHAHHHRRHLHSSTTSTTTSASTQFPFVRGAYTGFTQVAHDHAHEGARKLVTDHSSDNGWECTLASFGFTNRNVQPVNGRTRLVYG